MSTGSGKPKQPDRVPRVPECPRCQGYLIATRFEVDMLASAADSWPVGWRCVNCGAILDAQILRNRRQTSHGGREKGRQPVRTYRVVVLRS